MHQNWIQRIDQNTALFNEYFGALNRQKLNWKSDEPIWSIGQIIDHINKLNKDYFEVFSSLKAGSLKIPFFMKTKFVSNYFGNMLLETIEPERTKKIKTMKIWEPETQAISTNIMEEFEENQRLLIQLIHDLNNEIAENPIIHSPASKWITLPLNSAIEMLIQHELRHFNQGKKILGQIEELDMII